MEMSTALQITSWASYRPITVYLDPYWISNVACITGLQPLSEWCKEKVNREETEVDENASAVASSGN